MSAKDVWETQAPHLQWQGLGLQIHDSLFCVLVRARARTARVCVRVCVCLCVCVCMGGWVGGWVGFVGGWVE